MAAAEMVATLIHHSPNNVDNSNNNYKQSTAVVMAPPNAATTSDEVDFVKLTNNNNNIYNADFIKGKKTASQQSPQDTLPIQAENLNQNQSNHKETIPSTKSCKKKGNSNNNSDNNNAKKTTTKERLSLFSFGRRISGQKFSPESKLKVAISANTSTKISVQNGNCNSAAENSQMSNTFCMATLPAVPIGTPPRQHKFVKSSSIARLLGSSYHSKKYEKFEQGSTVADGKFHTYGGRRRVNGPYLERFKRYAKEDGDAALPPPYDAATKETIDSVNVAELCHSAELQQLEQSSGLERFTDNSTIAAGEDMGAKAMRTLSRGLGKLWFKRTHSIEISTPDPEYKVSYLGNVLTGWAKGEGCVKKQLNTLWRNYTQNNKPDMVMRIKVCASGLKATTRQHGLTEYWANRITHCCAPRNYPRIFCWIYRHEGRKLKHELRCHAVLCSKEKMVQEICNTLKENLECALREFKREKILKQNARLSLANAAYENPSLPRRKILLSVGGNNYRPPLERSKSAPKLMAIEEAIGEEDGEDAEETNEPEMKSCCQKDSLYPAMTLGRRRCRRGHSIRRTGKARPLCSISLDATNGMCCYTPQPTKESVVKCTHKCSTNVKQADEMCNNYGSDDSDDFEKLLKYNNYDTNTSLSTELMPYFDMQLHKNTSSSLNDLCTLEAEVEEEELLSILPTVNIDPNAHPEGDLITSYGHDVHDNDPPVCLRRNGICSDGEEDYLNADDTYFRQATMLNILQRSSMLKITPFSQSSDESSIETNSPASLQYRHQLQSSISSNSSSTATTNSSPPDGHVLKQRRQLNVDSDEGSISSGCETASTITANQDDISLQYQHSKQRQSQRTMLLLDIPLLHDSMEEHPVNEIYQRFQLGSQRSQESDATTFSCSSTIALKISADNETSCVTNSPKQSGTACNIGESGQRMRRQKRLTANKRGQHVGGIAIYSDSECSDESGYVEFLDREKSARDVVAATEARQGNAISQEEKQNQEQRERPLLPPKPAPRRTLTKGSVSNCGSRSTGTAV